MINPRELFPLISVIAKTDITQIVVGAWQEVQEMRKDIDVTELPFTLIIPTKKTLIEHTNNVARMAVEIAKSRAGLDFNLLIAGGLLHDIGKVLTYEKKGKGFIAGPLEKTLRHPVVGACLIAKYGNYDLIHIVYTHSHEGDRLTRSNEALVINHCDFSDFEIEKIKLTKFTKFEI